MGETPKERLEKLPPDVSDQRLPVSLILLYAVNSFLFLVLSFYFLPEDVVKIVGSAVGVALGVFGLKSLNPRETSPGPRLRQRRVVWGALVLATTAQIALLIIGFTNPCRIFAVPGSTVFVDGKFLERTPEPPESKIRAVANSDSPENIQPWLEPQENPHFLRWEPHEIKITKKWFVDNNHSQEIVQNVSVDVWQLFNPTKAFDEWKIKASQRPLLKIDYGVPDRTPIVAGADLSLPSASTFSESELRVLVQEWDKIWAAAFYQTDPLGHKRREPYVAALHIIPDRATTYLEFQIRDSAKLVKPLPPIRPTSPSIDISGLNQPLDFSDEEKKYLLAKSVRDEVFTQLLNELGIPAKIKPPLHVSLAQKLDMELEKSAATPPPAATPSASPTLAPNPSATALPTSSPLSSPVATPDASRTPDPTPFASATPPTTTVKELERVATDAVNSNKLDVAISAQKQLQTALTQIITKPQSEQSLQLENELRQSTQTVENAIKQKNNRGRVYIHISDELQRKPAGALGEKLKELNFAVAGIQNVGGRAYIPDTAEVRFFAFPDPPATKQAADNIVKILKDAGVRKARPSYVIPSDRELRSSRDINTHFEIWFARDSFAERTAN